MTRKLHGKIRGRTIELDEDPGVAEGQEVEVQMKGGSPCNKMGRRHPPFGGWLGELPGNGRNHGEDPAGAEARASASYTNPIELPGSDPASRASAPDTAPGG